MKNVFINQCVEACYSEHLGAKELFHSVDVLLFVVEEVIDFDCPSFEADRHQLIPFIFDLHLLVHDLVLRHTESFFVFIAIISFLQFLHLALQLSQRLSKPGAL